MVLEKSFARRPDNIVNNISSGQEKPRQKPKRPFFSSGPCPKPSSWSLNWLNNALSNRSHRSKEGKAKFNEAARLTRELLQLPETYQLFFVPGGGSGAFELALWSLLGPEKIDVLAFDHFGHQWASDIKDQLALPNLRIFTSDYGALPDLDALDSEADLVFCWCGTSSGARVPLSRIAPRKGKALSFIDGTSALFCENVDWQKCDIMSFSWQKALGSEASHGSLILSPRALERLENYSPPWPLPHIFQLKKQNKICELYLEHGPINTPSLLCLEDYISCLKWGVNLGGYDALKKRAAQNKQILNEFLHSSHWAANLVTEPEFRANSCVSMKIIAPIFQKLPACQQKIFLQKFCQILEKENIAFDIASYRAAPLGLRFWTGPTIEAQDLKLLTPWLDYAFALCLGQIAC